MVRECRDFRESTRPPNNSDFAEKFVETSPSVPLDAHCNQLFAIVYIHLRQLIARVLIINTRFEILQLYALLEKIQYIVNSTKLGEFTARTFADAINIRASSNALRNAPAYRPVCEHPALSLRLESIFGGSVRPFDFRWPRVTRLGDATGLHCDAPYMNRGSSNVLTTWIPLGDVSRSEGGLALLKSGPCAPQIESFVDQDVGKTSLGWFSGDPTELARRLESKWLWAEYKAGDALIFTMRTLLGSLVKNTSYVCVSSDTRFQPSEDSVDERWFGPYPLGHGRDRAFSLG